MQRKSLNLYLCCSFWYNFEKKIIEVFRSVYAKGAFNIIKSRGDWGPSILIYLQRPTTIFKKKDVFLEISQNLQENAYVKVSFLMKLQASGLQVFSCEFCKIFQNKCLFLKNISRQQLLIFLSKEFMVQQSDILRLLRSILLFLL